MASPMLAVPAIDSGGETGQTGSTAWPTRQRVGRGDVEERRRLDLPAYRNSPASDAANSAQAICNSTITSPIGQLGQGASPCWPGSNASDQGNCPQDQYGLNQPNQQGDNGNGHHNNH